MKADLASVTAAAGASKAMPEDFRVSITNASGKDVYPLSSFTWLLIPSKIQDPAKKKALKDFVNWMLDDGQTMVEALLRNFQKKSSRWRRKPFQDRLRSRGEAYGFTLAKSSRTVHPIVNL